MDLAALTATEQKALLDAGKASCRELLADCRTRAEMTEPVVNAIPTVHWETAEDLASRLDDNPNLLEGTPLRGLVTAFKDLNDTAGVLTTRGSLVFKDHVPTEDAPLRIFAQNQFETEGGRLVWAGLPTQAPWRAAGPHHGHCLLPQGLG